MTSLIEIWTEAAQPPDSNEYCCVRQNLWKLDVGGSFLADKQAECL